MTKRKYALIFACVIAFSAVVALCLAQEDETATASQPQVKREVAKKQVIGEIGGINSGFIAVDYEKDGKSTHEMALTMDKETKFYRRSLNELNVGDLVAVNYEEISEVKEGRSLRVLKRLAKSVEFRQPSKVKAGQETGVLESK